MSGSLHARTIKKGGCGMSENGDILEELWEVKRQIAEKYASFHDFFQALLLEQNLTTTAVA